jgi:hypothetical protein
MRRIKGVLFVAGALLAAFAYVWVAAVRAVPGVRARKADARRRSGAR